MTEDLNRYLFSRTPPPDRPLMGLTLLVVEDSRFASDALRLMALRSGARLRRADCLRAAHRHLQTYRPAVAIIDMGLPDGSGADLIRHIRMQGGAAAPALIGVSGDNALADEAQQAGAGAFLAKPLESLAQFQHCVLSVLRQDARPPGLRPVADERISPDPIALRDDLSRVAQILAERPDAASVGYVARFLCGVARSAHDSALERAARDLDGGRVQGGPVSTAAILRASGLVQARIAAASAL